MSPSIAGAQTSGRISGRVQDASTGAPLPGASVRAEAFDLEAITSEAGRFVLAGLPAGEVDLAVDLLGYRPLRLRGVTVRAGRAVDLAIALAPSAFELDPIVVDAERIPLIEPEVSETREVVTGAVLRELPVTRIGEAVELSTGVSDGHFRGGQIGQEVYLVDGFAVKNQLEATTGGSAIELAPTSLRELEVVTGGFGAEYGSARSASALPPASRPDRSASCSSRTRGTMSCGGSCWASERARPACVDHRTSYFAGSGARLEDGSSLT